MFIFFLWEIEVFRLKSTVNQFPAHASYLRSYELQSTYLTGEVYIRVLPF